MLMRIGGVLSPDETAAIVRSLDQAAFEDGRRTAGWHARQVKRNEQASAGPAVDGALAKVRQALLGNEVFMAAARPRSFVKLLVSRYAPDMAYGPTSMMRSWMPFAPICRSPCSSPTLPITMAAN